MEKPVYRQNDIYKDVVSKVEKPVVYEQIIPVEHLNIVEEIIEVPIEKYVDKPI